LKIKALVEKLVLVLAVTMSFGIVYEAQATDDDCQSWTHRGYPVTMEVCSRANGNSGYIVITNNGNQDAEICWTTVSNNGYRNRGCKLSLGAGESETSSAAQCGTNTQWGGCSQIILESYKVNR
jgi:hypothetical protein